MAKTKIERRAKIKKRIRKRISGTHEKPRMTVFRSNKHIFVQLIDDIKGHTLVSTSSRVKEISQITGNKTQKAAEVGKLIAQKALNAGITSVVFDRNGYLYHGRVKALAEAARQNGLKF
ncbi:MAG: 50S ribosomal protein L18 [Bacteroidales bacterium]|nr:50S ribosomal protein L18 [Bacteroidales bacterium]